MANVNNNIHATRAQVDGPVVSCQDNLYFIYFISYNLFFQYKRQTNGLTRDSWLTRG